MRKLPPNTALTQPREQLLTLVQEVRDRGARILASVEPGTQRGRCLYLGEATGERRVCPTCSGHVEVKVMGCGKYGACTVGKLVDGLACCQTCADYQPVPRQQ